MTEELKALKAQQQEDEFMMQEMEMAGMSHVDMKEFYGDDTDYPEAEDMDALFAPMAECEALDEFYNRG